MCLSSIQKNTRLNMKQSLNVFVSLWTAGLTLSDSVCFNKMCLRHPKKPTSKGSELEAIGCFGEMCVRVFSGRV